MTYFKQGNEPSPLISSTQPVKWWFAFKFNAATFPGCAEGEALPQKGIFGGKPAYYTKKPSDFSTQYAFASDQNPTLVKGSNPIGTTLNDPVGATFNQIYNGDFNYVIWNDQLHSTPLLEEFAGPWSHSKGALCWNDDGEGFVMQVSTPSWPASGSVKHPRYGDGNTLGYTNDNSLIFSQHFFALKTTVDDNLAILKSLLNSFAVTNPLIPQLVRNGGPQEMRDIVYQLAQQLPKRDFLSFDLSSGVKLLSKPSNQKFFTPPWHLISAKMGGLPLRVASFWTAEKIFSTDKNVKLGCWNSEFGKPGRIEVATSGTWQEKKFSLEGPASNAKGAEQEGYNDSNHAKIGVSLDPNQPYVILGDMNDQGALYQNYAFDGQLCDASQNSRGGMFFVLNDVEFWKSITSLLSGDTAPFVVDQK